jgi:hypothetical protein
MNLGNLHRGTNLRYTSIINSQPVWVSQRTI